MTTSTLRARTWAMIHAEREALAGELAGLDDAAWETPSLCTQWSVRDVVAHLTAGASAGRWAWLRSIAGARFDADLHNARRLAEHRGSTPAETLERFRAVVTSTVAPSGHTAAWLGEVVVHGQDVRTPLGLPRVPPVATTTEVARFFVARDFTVSGRAVARGLRLEATDGPFVHGDGPVVRGSTLALVMVLAGRPASCDELTGAGLRVVRERIR
ncbi:MULTISPECIES: maleylpyruvate isomerase family mycothiol-dependent enzyme [unclassified Isoptericola]|uniref:maleylpyruvate isomerase family mycothiol-dependent enzyme n=1 Tax=unclassified Isoptericola TaxID=2623355 RepID=UPI00366117CE